MSTISFAILDRKIHFWCSSLFFFLKITLLNVKQENMN